MGARRQGQRQDSPPSLKWSLPRKHSPCINAAYQDGGARALKRETVGAGFPSRGRHALIGWNRGSLTMRRFLPFPPRSLSSPPSLLAGLVALSVWGVAAPARAEPSSVDPSPHAHTYAVIVGSNQGGAGQAPLRFA